VAGQSGDAELVSDAFNAMRLTNQVLRHLLQEIAGDFSCQDGGPFVDLTADESQSAVMGLLEPTLHGLIQLRAYGASFDAGAGDPASCRSSKRWHNDL
jgi:hypothetical protein